MKILALVKEVKTNISTCIVCIHGVSLKGLLVTLRLYCYCARQLVGEGIYNDKLTLASFRNSGVGLALGPHSVNIDKAVAVMACSRRLLSRWVLWGSVEIIGLLLTSKIIYSTQYVFERLVECFLLCLSVLFSVTVSRILRCGHNCLLWCVILSDLHFRIAARKVPHLRYRWDIWLALHDLAFLVLFIDSNGWSSSAVWRLHQYKFDVSSSFLQRAIRRGLLLTLVIYL